MASPLSARVSPAAFSDSSAPARRLGDEVLERLGGFHPGASLRAHHVLFYEGAPCREVFCIRSGKVKLYKTGLEGKQYILRIAGAGEIVGLETLMNGAPAHASAEMIDTGLVHRIDRRLVVDLLRRDPELALWVVESLTNKLRGSDDERLELAQAAVRERMAKLLSTLAADHGVRDVYGVRIDLPLSREEMAGMIGTAQETVIRQLSEFKQDQLIRLDGRRITVLDPARLLATANPIN